MISGVGSTSSPLSLLFTDIEGSTLMLKRLGERYADALETHRAIIRRALARNGGREVDTEGDAFFAAFARPGDAIRAAVMAQRALGRHRWPGSDRVKVRMGIHAGHPTPVGDGYVGLDVHLGARIAAAAHGDQILVSESVARSDTSLPAGTSFRGLGSFRLKYIGPQ